MSKSRIFLYFNLSFILGVVASSFVKIPILALGIFLIVGIALASIFWAKQWKLVIVSFCLIIFSFGIWRFQQASIVKNNISRFNDEGRMKFNGIVTKEADIRMENMKFEIGDIQIKENQSFAAKVLITANKYPEYKYGDRVEIIGNLQTPKNFDDFDYQAYLIKDNIYSVMYYPEIKLLGRSQGSKIKSVLFFIKDKFKKSISKSLPEPQAAFLNGLILGEKKAMPEELMDSFSKTGTTHIVALSGYNITIIAWAIMSILTFFLISRRTSFWLSVLCIFLFTLMVGAGASVVRASIMGILVLLARKEGRLYNIKNALVFAGALMIYLNPKILRFDLSFQLSFLATIGLIYVAPFFEKIFEKLTNFMGLREILSATLSAQIMVLPLVLFSFGRLSLVAPLANILILPFIPYTMFLGFVAGLVGIFVGIFGKVIAWLVWLFLSYEIWVAEFFAKWPGAYFGIKINFILMSLFYIIICYVIIYLRKRFKKILIKI